MEQYSLLSDFSRFEIPRTLEDVHRELTSAEHSGITKIFSFSRIRPGRHKPTMQFTTTNSWCGRLLLVIERQSDYEFITSRACVT